MPPLTQQARNLVKSIAAPLIIAALLFVGSKLWALKENVADEQSDIARIERGQARILDAICNVKTSHVCADPSAVGSVVQAGAPKP